MHALLVAGEMVQAAMNVLPVAGEVVQEALNVLLVAGEVGQVRARLRVGKVLQVRWGRIKCCWWQGRWCRWDAAIQTSVGGGVVLTSGTR